MENTLPTSGLNATSGSHNLSCIVTHASDNEGGTLVPTTDTTKLETDDERELQQFAKFPLLGRGRVFGNFPMKLQWQAMRRVTSVGGGLPQNMTRKMAPNFCKFPVAPKEFAAASCAHCFPVEEAEPQQRGGGTANILHGTSCGNNFMTDAAVSVNNNFERRREGGERQQTAAAMPFIFQFTRNEQQLMRQLMTHLAIANADAIIGVGICVTGDEYKRLMANEIQVQQYRQQVHDDAEQGEQEQQQQPEQNSHIQCVQQQQQQQQQQTQQPPATQINTNTFNVNDDEIVVVNATATATATPAINSINTNEIPSNQNNEYTHQQRFAQQNEEAAANTNMLPLPIAQQQQQQQPATTIQPLLSFENIMNAREFYNLSAHEAFARRTAPAIINNGRIFSEQQAFATRSLRTMMPNLSTTTAATTTTAPPTTTISQFINNLYISSSNINNIGKDFSHNANNSDVSEQSLHEDEPKQRVFVAPNDTETTTTPTTATPETKLNTRQTIGNTHIAQYQQKIAEIFGILLEFLTAFLCGARTTRSVSPKFSDSQNYAENLRYISVLEALAANSGEFGALIDAQSFEFAHGKENDEQRAAATATATVSECAAMTVTKAQDEVTDEGVADDIDARIDIDIGTRQGQLQRNQNLILNETTDDMKFEMRNVKGGTAAAAGAAGAGGVASVPTTAGSLTRNLIGSGTRNSGAVSAKPMDVAEKYASYTAPTTIRATTDSRLAAAKPSSVELEAILPECTRLRRQRRLRPQESLEQAQEDPIERLNRLKARISGALSEVKGVLKQYSTDAETDADNVQQQATSTPLTPRYAPITPISSRFTLTPRIEKENEQVPPKADDGSSAVNFRFVKKVRRRSLFNEEEEAAEQKLLMSQHSQPENGQVNEVSSKNNEERHDQPKPDVAAESQAKESLEITREPSDKEQLPARAEETPTTPKEAKNLVAKEEGATNDAAPSINSESSTSAASDEDQLPVIEISELETSGNKDAAAQNQTDVGTNDVAGPKVVRKSHKIKNQTATARRASVAAVELSKIDVPVAPTMLNTIKSQRRPSDSEAILKKKCKGKARVAAADDGSLNDDTAPKVKLNKVKRASVKQIKSLGETAKTTATTAITAITANNNNNKINETPPQHSEANNSNKDVIVAKTTATATATASAPASQNLVLSTTTATATTTTIANKTAEVVPKPIEINDAASAANVAAQTKTIRTAVITNATNETGRSDVSIIDDRNRTETNATNWPMPNSSMVSGSPAAVEATSHRHNNRQQQIAKQQQQQLQQQQLQIQHSIDQQQTNEELKAPDDQLRQGSNRETHAQPSVPQSSPEAAESVRKEQRHEQEEAQKQKQEQEESNEKDRQQIIDTARPEEDKKTLENCESTAATTTTAATLTTAPQHSANDSNKLINQEFIPATSVNKQQSQQQQQQQQGEAPQVQQVSPPIVDAAIRSVAAATAQIPPPTAIAQNSTVSAAHEEPNCGYIANNAITSNSNAASLTDAPLTDDRIGSNTASTKIQNVPNECSSIVTTLDALTSTTTTAAAATTTTTTLTTTTTTATTPTTTATTTETSAENMPDLLQTASAPVQAPTILDETLKDQHHQHQHHQNAVVNKKKIVTKKIARKTSTEKAPSASELQEEHTKIVLPNLLFSKGTVNKIRQNEIVVAAVQKSAPAQQPTAAAAEEVPTPMPTASEVSEELATAAAAEAEVEVAPAEPAPVKKERKIKKKVIIKRQKRKLSISDNTFFKETDDAANGTSDANNAPEIETLEKAIAYVTDDEADADEQAAAAENEHDTDFAAKQPLKSCLRSREYQIGDMVMYAERYKKTQVRWKRGIVLERITSISYKLEIDGKEVPAHISYIKKYTDRKVNFGCKEYLEIDYEQVAEEEKRTRSYSIWNMV